MGEAGSILQPPQLRGTVEKTASARSRRFFQTTRVQHVNTGGECVKFFLEWRISNVHDALTINPDLTLPHNLNLNLNLNGKVKTSKIMIKSKSYEED